MKPDRLSQIKKEYFRVEAMRSGRSTDSYELPEEVLRLYELGEEIHKARERRRKEEGRKPEEVIAEYPGKLCTHLSRRSVGDFSLPEPDDPSFWEE